MKKLLIALVLVFLPSLTMIAQEVIHLPTPLPAINDWMPASLTLTTYPIISIQIILVHPASGRTEVFLYPCALCQMDTDDEVKVMITTLNTANLSQRSLWRRIMDRLLIDFPTRFPQGAVVQ